MCKYRGLVASHNNGLLTIIEPLNVNILSHNHFFTERISETFRFVTIVNNKLLLTKCISVNNNILNIIILY